MWAVALALVALFAAQSWQHYYRPDGSDLRLFLAAARDVATNGDPYGLHSRTPFLNCKYPLFLPFLLIPALALPIWLVLPLWSAASILGLTASLRLADGVGAASDGPHAAAWPKLSSAERLAAAFLAFLLLLGPIQSDFRNGQTNLIVTGLCAWSLSLVRRRRIWPAALTWAAAISIKLLPLSLAGFFLVRRDFRMLWRSALLVVVLCLMPVATMGLANVLDAYRHYIGDFLLGSGMARGIAGSYRISSSLSHVIDFLLPQWTGSGARMGAALAAFAGLCALDASTRHAPRPEDADGVWFAAYLAVAVLMNPIGETHHLVLLLPAARFLLVAPVVGGERAGRSAIAAAGAFVVLQVASRFVKDVPLEALAILVLVGATPIVERSLRRLAAANPPAS